MIFKKVSIINFIQINPRSLIPLMFMVVKILCSSLLVNIGLKFKIYFLLIDMLCKHIEAL